MRIINSEFKESRKSAPRVMVLGSKEGRGSAHIDKFLPSLVGCGANVTFIGWDRNCKLRSRFEQDGIVHKYIFRGGGYGSKMLKGVLPLWCIRLFVELLFARADVIYAIDLECGFPAALVRCFRRLPLVYVILDTYALRPTIPSYMRKPIQWVDNWTMKQSDYIIVPDETRILEEYCEKEKFVVIYNCASDVSDSVPKERRLRGNKPFTILATGRLMKNRGIGLLLEVAEKCDGVQLLLAGDVPEPDIRSRLNLFSRARFVGRVALEDSFRMCFDADVVFTFYEPNCEINRRAASNKWSDAMMAARPILANVELVKAEWIRKNDIGYLCDYDAVALEQCVRSIMANRGEAVRKGENGRRLFEKGYNWRAMEKRLWALTEIVCNQSLPRS